MKKLYMKKLGLLVFMSLITIISVVAQTTTWYAINDGDWKDHNNWTLDPAAAVYYNPSNSYPQTVSDNIVINSGREISVLVEEPEFILNCGTITINGRLDLGATSGHSFTQIRGNGRLLMQGDNFPTTEDDTHFITKGQGAGTVVLEGNSFTLSTVRTYYNLEVDMNPGQTVTLEEDYSLNGNLYVNGGTFQINGATARNLTVDGNITVSADATFNVGTGNAIHIVNAFGDFKNYGTVQFSNSEQYSAATTGAVKVYFKGATNNDLVCNGSTEFYRMFLDKGTDKTYILSVNANHVDNFKLFGPISGGDGVEVDDGPQGWERLALVLKNGTLKLESNIVIPQLGENRTGTSPNEFHIPYNARFWINGADVSTSDAGGGWRGVTVFGTLQVSSGTFTNPANTGGITYFSNSGAPGLLLIEGTGKVYTTQLKQADGSGQFNYIQSGGELHINALSESRGSSAIFALPQTSHVFEMTGGKIIIDAINTTATNGIDIGVGEGNANVTGGTIEIQTPTLDAAAQNQFKIKSTAPFYNLTISQSAYTGMQSVVLQSDLSVLNDLIIGSATTLDAGDLTLSIGKDFTNNGTYITGTNITRFFGSNNSIINGGSITFNSLELDKDYETQTVTLNDGVISILDNLIITSGTLSIGASDRNLGGNIEIEAGEITGASALVLNGTSQQTLKGKDGLEQSFGNLKLNNLNHGIALLSDVNVEAFSFAETGTGKVVCGANNFTVSGALSESGPDRHFVTSGKASDGGLTLGFTIPTTIGTLATFPVASPSGYTPAIVKTVATSSSSSNGYFTVIPVNSYHPATDPSKTTDVLNYYWKSKVAGFEGLEDNKVRIEFTSLYELKLWSAAYLNGYQWTIGEYKYKTNDYTLIFDNTANHGLYKKLIASDYTAGLNNGQGKIPIASIKVFTSTSNHDWNTTSWVDQDGGAGTPGASDVAVISNGHVVTISANNADASIVQVDGELVVNAGTSGHDIDLIKGNGRLKYNSAILINGDHSDFCNTSSAILEYAGGGYVLPPAITTYPNLYISGPGAKTAADVSLLIKENLFIDDAIFNVSSNVNGDISIYNDLIVNTGSLVLPNSRTRTLTVDGDITIVGTGDFKVNTGGSAREHQINIKGDILQGDGYFYLSATAYAKINFIGIESSTVSKTGLGTTEFHNITVNKPSDNKVHFTGAFELLGSANGSTKAMTLISGEVHLSNSNILFDLSTGGDNFKIPAAASLKVDNGATVKVGGAASNTGIWLDGSLIIDNGGKVYVDQGSGAFTDNYIEYTASGNASIWVGGNAELIVGSQLRRTTITDAGILKFTQAKASSTIALGTKSAQINNRGVFEILNNGSSFTQSEAGSNISILRGQDAPTTAGLYFDPDLVWVAANSGFTLGGLDTPVDNIIGVYAGKNLNNLTVNSANATVQLQTVPMLLDGNLDINAGTFNANGLDVSIAGNFVNSGTYLANGNTTYFTGIGNQTITGASAFFNFVKQGGSILNLDVNTEITVDNNVDLISGAFDTGENSVIVKGNTAIEEGFYTSSSGVSAGFILEGGAQQQLSGSGTFARLTINNANGVFVPTQASSVNYSQALRLQAGVLDIGRNLMILEKDATIEAVKPFSDLNMIQTNLSFTDAGIRKYLPSGASSFTFPIGSAGKFTPVVLNITSNSSENGYIRVKAANEYHITVVDENNVLHYNWTLDSKNFTNLNGNVVFQAMPADVKATPLENVDNYIVARILEGSAQWEKFEDIFDNGTLIEGFDKVNSKLIFRFINNNDSEINGDYTAGTSDAIPNEIPSYITFADGDWTNSQTWARYFPDTNTIGEVGFVPRGSIIYVTKDLTVNQNFMSAFRTNIQTGGKVIVGSTVNHRFGSVAGQGRLVLVNGSFPAGIYDDFFSENGGVVEFSGTTDYDFLSNIPVVNSLVFSGTGERRFPNQSLSLNGSLTLDGAGVVLKNVDNDPHTITIKGNLTINLGSYISKAEIINMNGSAAQTIGGIASFTGACALNKLAINNAAGVTLANNLDIKNTLTFTSGKINTSASAILKMTSTENNIISGASSSGFVNGPMQKMINATSSFAFPTGKDSRFGQISLNGVGASGLWTAEYFNTGDSDRGTFDGSVKYVSNSEYWQVTSPVSSVNAVATLRWDANSGINPDDAAFRVVSSSGTIWSAVDYSDKVGTMSAGTVKTVALNYASTRRFTFGSNNIDAYTWVGITSNDWFLGSNWAGGAVPSASNNAIVAISSKDPVIFINDGAIAQTNDLTIENGASLTMNPGGKMTVNRDFTIGSTGEFIMENRYGPDGMASLIVNGAYSGESKVKLKLPTNNYYYLGSPMFVREYQHFGAGVPEMKVGLERNGSWQMYSSSSPTNLEILKLEGALVLTPPSASDIEFSFDGAFNNEAVSRSFTSRKYYLFANPYPSYIDWQKLEGWNRTNIEGTIWYRTRVNTEMAFVTYNKDAPEFARAALLPDGVASEEELSLIPPLQSIWIGVERAATLTVDPSVRVHGLAGSKLKSSRSGESADVIRIVAKNESSLDGAVLYFSDEATEGLDAGDSKKYFNSSTKIPEVYTIAAGNSLAINGLPRMNEGYFEIPISVRNRVISPVTLKIDLGRYNSNHRVMLIDREMGEYIPLETQSEYTYTPNEMGENHTRFALSFTPGVTTNIESPLDDEVDAGNSISIKGIAGKVLVSVGMELVKDGAGSVEIYTIEGRKVSEVPARSSRTLVILPNSSEVFIIRAKFGNQVKSERVMGALK